MNKSKDEFIDDYIAKVGKRIKALRKEEYSNYEQFAFTHEINRGMYSRHENGNDMRLSSFLKILYALDKTPKEFFAEGFDEIEPQSKED